MLGKIKLKLIALFLIILYGCESPNKSQQESEFFLGQPVPGDTPIRFAENIITDNFYPHSKMIISPNEDRIYWTTFRNLNVSEYDLYFSDFDGTNLVPAIRDTGLVKYGILNFTFENDENHILFGSRQPNNGMSGDSVRAAWKSEKSDSGWSKPQPILSTLDTNWASLGSVSINTNGDIYFCARIENATAKIYRTKFENENYQAYEALPDIINTGIAVDPFIDFQDRYLLFSAFGRNENIGIIDLYISFKDENENWTAPMNLGSKISTQYLDRFPMVTNDGKYLFFVTSHSDYFPSEHTHFYWVDAGFIEEQ